jgi:hypothetical protein
MALYARNAVVTMQGDMLRLTIENRDRMADVLVSRRLAENLARELDARLHPADAERGGLTITHGGGAR